MEYGSLAADVAEAVEKHVEFPEVDIPSIDVLAVEDDTAPEEAARQVRNEWGLESGPMKHLVRALERSRGARRLQPNPDVCRGHMLLRIRRQTGRLPQPNKHDYYRQRSISRMSWGIS